MSRGYTNLGHLGFSGTDFGTTFPLYPSTAIKNTGLTSTLAVQYQFFISVGGQQSFLPIIPHVGGRGGRNYRFGEQLLKYELPFVSHQNTLREAKRQMDKQRQHLSPIAM